MSLKKYKLNSLADKFKAKGELEPKSAKVDKKQKKSRKIKITTNLGKKKKR